MTRHGSPRPFSRRRPAQAVFASRVAVLDPGQRLLQRPGAHVQADVRLGAELGAVGQVLVGAEPVGFLPAPGQLGAAWPAVLGPDPVGPVVVADEVPARPAQHAEPQLAEQAEHVLAEAAVVGQRRALLVQPAVDAPSEVLDEPAEHLPVEPPDGPGRINGDPGQWRSFVVGMFRPPQESRTISSTGSSGVRSGTGSPAMLRSSNSTACRAGFRQRDAHGAQRRRQELGERDVVAAHHRHVGRYPAPGLPQRGQHADGHHVAVHEDRGEPGRAFEQQPGRDGAALRGPVALGHQVLARLQPRVAQRVLVAVQPAAGDPPPERAGDRADRGVPQSEEVGGCQPPGLPVVRSHQRDAAAGHRLQADRRHVPPEQLGDLGVLLDLGRGGDDAVHPALDQRPHDVGPVRAARRQVPDQHRVPVLARGLLGGHRGLRDGHVGGVAGDQPDGGGGPLDQAPGDRVRPVPELGRRGQDPLLGLRRTRARRRR